MGTSGEITYPELAPDAEVYRAYPFPDSFNNRTGKPMPKLFYRKATESGLSVGLSPEGTLLRYPGAVGMCRLIVRDIADCPDPLRLARDAIDHAEITGVPTRDEDQERALRIAKYLARVAEHCGDPPFRA
jgi:hypothetical protein